MQELIYGLFGDTITAERRLCLVTLPDKKHTFHASVKDAYGYAAEVMQKAEVYFCVGLMKGDDGDPHRYEKDVLAIGGFWADIDLDAPYRKGKKALPKTMDEAKSILAKLPLAPSVLVDSGHGLHVYWVFREPWVFDGDDERLKARRLSDGWKARMRQAAGECGWAIDSVSELNRIMRLPGTFNRKGDVPVAVRVLESHDDIRYNPSDFEEYASAQMSSQETQGATVQLESLILTPSAQPPVEKFAALMRDVPLFVKTWNRQRDDFKTDQSQSVYDMALADIAALNQWTPQEIANLLIAARTKHNDNVQKALRAGYMTDTVGKAIRMAKERMANGVDLSCFTVKQPTEISGPRSLRQLVREYPVLRSPVIEGLLRQGETMNIISATKIGKSWLATDLALAVATGRPWLGMQTVRGDVLILDNELHGETSANRIPKVAKARGMDFDEVADHLFVHNLRGQLQTIDTLERYFRQFEPGRFSMVILDAFYRFLPVRTDENDNGTMANLYNILDSFSDYMKSSFVLIHHTSKGNQSLKDVTDVGAGAGAQSRATDTHLVLRRHEQNDVVVLEAAVRSWPPLPPRCLRWAWPIWMPADDLNPDSLKKEGSKKAAKTAETAKRLDYDTPGFVKRFIAEIPKSEDRIHEETEAEGLSGRRTSRFIRLAEQDGLIYSHVIGPKGIVGWATVPQPEDEIQDDRKRLAVETLLHDEPNLSTKDVAERCGVSRQYVNRIRKESE